jgi:O-antigen/teichoic acid export membrane protein
MSQESLIDDPLRPAEPSLVEKQDDHARDSANTQSPADGAKLGRNRLQFLQTVAVSFAVVLLQMAQGILLARLLGPEGRGQYATAVFYAQTLLYVGLLGGLEVICRYAAENEIDRTRLRRAALRLGIVTGTISTVVVISLCVVALPADKRYLMPMAMLCSLSLLGQHVMLIMTAVDRGSGQFGAYNLRRVLAAAAFPALLLIAASVIQVDLLTVCLLFVAASIVSMAACIVGLRQPLRGDYAPRVKPLLKESRPYALSMLVTDLFERLDLFLILWLVPIIDQGYYAAMVPVAYPLIVIPNTMGLFLFNAGASPDHRLTTRDVNRILGSALAVQAVMTAVFMLLIGMVVRFLYGADFAPAVIYALWLAPAAAIRGILQGLDSYVKGRGRPLAPIRCRIFAAAVILIVSLLLVDQYGAVAIAMAALVGQILCLIWLSAIVYADVRSMNSPQQST